MDTSPPRRMMARIYIDLAAPVQMHAHVRLKVASVTVHTMLVVDAVVICAGRGELVLDILRLLLPEFADVDWDMYQAGGVASQAMRDTVRHLVVAVP